jgi:hypothetical protein
VLKVSISKNNIFKPYKPKKEIEENIIPIPIFFQPVSYRFSNIEKVFIQKEVENTKTKNIQELCSRTIFVTGVDSNLNGTTFKFKKRKKHNRILFVRFFS